MQGGNGIRQRGAERAGVHAQRAAEAAGDAAQKFKARQAGNPGGIGDLQIGRAGAGGDRFAGATYDPTSHYRAAEVFAYFEARGLNPALLREVSQHQVGLPATWFDDLDLDSRLIARDHETPLDALVGLLALQSLHACILIV